MKGEPTEERPDAGPDAELRQLVSLFLDHGLNRRQRDRLEQRLREEPAAKAYCVESLRFEAAMQEAADPKALEWEETRRVMLDFGSGSPGWSVQRQQTMRYGAAGSWARPPASVRRKRWIAGGLVAAVALAGLAYWFEGERRARKWSARNGDFEAMDLRYSPHGVGRSLLSWQDYFSTPDAELCEIGRVSQGRIHARSGRNVARLRPQAYLTQRILNGKGEALTARPGWKVVLKGWYYTDGEGEMKLRSGLRFVASGQPDMIQYEAVAASSVLKKGGWHPFRLELALPGDLTKEPSDLEHGISSEPPGLDLHGKELTLSIDNHCAKADLLLDDLEIEALPPGS